MRNLPDNLSLLYVTNPMCAWCYGFTPVVRRLKALWQGRLDVQVLFGDLQAHQTKPLLHDQKERLALSWHRVQERTYLPFEYRFFIQRSFVFNTEPACRAMLCVRLLRPVLTLEVLRAMHSAFFVDNADLKDTRELVRLVGLFGIPENLFMTLFESEEITQQMEDEFAYVNNIGATTFPSLFLNTENGPERLAAGYVELHELEQRLFQLL
ncbi:DsbA family protein [Pontibacter korlensis]|uniref:Dithiol-disulfide isomerase n=1 Tax=Pontibacter korlensis TaxID=400092 RepID=A0A0E3ZES5_9BACT|nr:DsbA family protein [Pontibacter korlensis]AKD03854.1 dithiol-disulfide isomerase [Pontibacter korlensis]